MLGVNISNDLTWKQHVDYVLSNSEGQPEPLISVYAQEGGSL